MLTVVPYIAEVVVLAISNFIAFVPTITRFLLFKEIEFFHKDVVSDIPGNPHSFDAAVISLFRILPEPSDFNLVWTSISLKEPLLIRGVLPQCRYNSMTVYGAGTDEPPNSIELYPNEKGSDRFFEVVIANDTKKGDIPAKYMKLSSADWKYGLIAMRNYVVPPGTLVTTPEIARLSDGVVIRPASDVVAGPAVLDLRESKALSGAVRVLATNAALALIKYTCQMYFNLSFNPLHSSLLMLVGFLLGVGLYKLCFVAGQLRLKQMTSDICKTPNELYQASLEQGSKASQPSKLHTYWAMQLEVPPGSELAVRGRIDPALQKYWSLVVYDQYGLPLPQYVYDENVKRIHPSNSSSGKNSGGSSSSSSVYDYDIRLRNAAKTSSSSSHGSSSTTSSSSSTVVDVSSIPRGYVLFRINHPVGDHVAVFSQPRTSMMQTQSSSQTQSLPSQSKSQSVLPSELKKRRK